MITETHGGTMRITFRGVALLSCLAVMTSASGAYAAQNHAGAAPKPKPQITDAKGDYPVASADIISATLSTVTEGTKELLQIGLELAAAPTTLVPYSYTVGFEVGGCSFRAVYFGHPSDALNRSAVGCVTGNTSVPEGKYTIKGSTITFTVSRYEADGGDGET